MGAAIALFATIGAETPVAVIVVLALLFGGVASLQYTSMGTLAFAEIDGAGREHGEHDREHASSKCR